MSTAFKFWLLGLLALLLSFAPEAAQAQRRRTPRPKAKAGTPKDFFKIRAPKIRYVRPDTSVVVETEELPDDNSEAAKSVFKPAKPLSIVSEDTSTLNLGEQSIVEMSEEVLIDSSWIKVAGYYSIWDTRYVNPYRRDPSRYRDTLTLHLTDPARQRLARMPLTTTPVTSGFRFRGYRWHYGVDLDLETGDSVKAAFDGVVRVVNWDGGGYGNYIVVRHYNGLETVYGHLSKQLVRPGTFVKAGDLIGKGGSTGRSTGSHLHYEVRYEGNPINPEEIYNFPEYQLKKENLAITAALFNYAGQAARMRAAVQARSGSAHRPTAARRTVSYRVRSGDTLSEIADKHGVSQAQIRRLNDITGKTTLRVGRTLRIK
ncbi:M23 family metallopeptidase [Hymenobacter jeollabukensis]|uniref:M23 family metallopeptidase n=1 Tax=Hymenobacter jeollabukensis TaxID=2025313 RepID=UPI001FE7DF60|nr:M23 family metallopeptidase [Hymenobacter jeollabukensis]